MTINQTAPTPSSAPVTGSLHDLDFMKMVVARNDVLLIDTSSLMEAGSERGRLFYPRLAQILMETGKRACILEESLLEMQRIASNESGHHRPEQQEAAWAACDMVQAMLDQKLMWVEAARSQTGFADPSIQSFCLLHKSHAKLCVITQDLDLADDLHRISGDSLSVQGKPIHLQKISTRGFLAQNQRQESAPETARLTFSGSLRPSVPGEPRAVDMPGEGDALRTQDGRQIILGEYIANGSGGFVFRIQNDEKQVAKLFHEIDPDTEARLTLLCESKLNIPGAVLPQRKLYDAQGQFIGYTMEYIHGVSLVRLFNPDIQARFAPHFTRADYVRIAHQLVDTVMLLNRSGLLWGDVSPTNVIIGCDESGKPDSSKVFIIDLDGSQTGRADGVFPALGLTRKYIAPELLRDDIDTESALRPLSSQLFSVTLLACQCVMLGVHPFNAVVEEGEPPLSLEDRMMRGLFAYGAAGNPRAAKCPQGAQYIWSYLTPEAKLLFRTALTCEPERRPALLQIKQMLGRYLTALTNFDAEQYPEMLSLAPQGYKPFYQTCECGRRFDVSNERGFFRDGLAVCPGCVSKTFSVCRDCGKPVATRLDQLLGRRIHPFCPECWEKREAARQQPAAVPTKPVTVPIQSAPQPTDGGRKSWFKTLLDDLKRWTA